MTWTWTLEVPFGISDLANGLAFKHFLSDGVLMNNAAVEEARPRDLAGDLFWLLGPLVRTTEEFGDDIFRVTHQTVEENSEDSKGKQPELQVRYPSLVEDSHIHVAKVFPLSIILYVDHFNHFTSLYAPSRVIL